MIKDDIKLANFDINRITDIKQRQKAVKWWNERLIKKDRRVKFNNIGIFYLEDSPKLSAPNKSTSSKLSPLK